MEEAGCIWGLRVSFSLYFQLSACLLCSCCTMMQYSNENFHVFIFFYFGFCLDLMPVSPDPGFSANFEFRVLFFLACLPLRDRAMDV